MGLVGVNSQLAGLHWYVRPGGRLPTSEIFIFFIVTEEPDELSNIAVAGGIIVMVSLYATPTVPSGKVSGHISPGSRTSLHVGSGVHWENDRLGITSNEIPKTKKM